MKSWKLVWREGFVPNLSRECLEVLKKALEIDDSRLIQGATTTPPPLMCVRDWPIESGDALAFMGWQGANCETVGEAEEFFAKLCFEADRKLGEPAACRWFLNWYDDTPRNEMLRQLLHEVKIALGEACSFHEVDNPYLCGSPDCKHCRFWPKGHLAGATN